MPFKKNTNKKTQKVEKEDVEKKKVEDESSDEEETEETAKKMTEGELMEKAKDDKGSDYSGLKTAVNKWKALQQKKKDISKQIKDINTEANTLKEVIMQHMDKLQIGVISTSDGSIEKITKKQKEGFKEEMIEDNLKTYLNNTVEAEAITKHIVANRKVKLVEDLKFTKKKGK